MGEGVNGIIVIVMLNKTDKNELIAKRPGPPITEFHSSPMKT